MQVHNYTDKLAIFHNAVLTIGTFDGVHLGHQKIIAQLVEEAKKVNGTSVVITFFPHPKSVIAQKKNQVELLNTQEEKYKLLESLGVQHVVVVPFDMAFSHQSPHDYIYNFIIKHFRPHTIIIGYDHRFGKDRAGDYLLLEVEAQNNNFVVREIPEKVLKDVTISSTKIRDALLDGDVDTASAYLGYRYRLSGIVTEGKKLGRTIGYPTANISTQTEEKLIPANGVYIVKAQLNNVEYAGMLNIGNRPTVGGTIRTIEVNIFDFDKSIYGERLTIIFQKRLRDEVKFPDLEALKKQLSEDKKKTIKFFQREI